MFELLELDPRFNNAAQWADGPQVRGPEAVRPSGQASAGILKDDGTLSQGETLLLLAGLSSVLGSIWLTVTAII
ncbi:MAG: hypothetical protein AAGG11_09095 [Pseudomonadota bacterium]